MSETIPQWVADLGAGGLLAVAILLILTGRLIWHRLAERMIEMKAQEADDWHDAYLDQVAANRVLTDSLPKLVEGQEVIVKVLDSLPRLEPEQERET